MTDSANIDSAWMTTTTANKDTESDEMLQINNDCKTIHFPLLLLLLFLLTSYIFTHFIIKDGPKQFHKQTANGNNELATQILKIQ